MILYLKYRSKLIDFYVNMNMCIGQSYLRFGLSLDDFVSVAVAVVVCCCSFPVSLSSPFPGTVEVSSMSWVEPTALLGTS